MYTLIADSGSTKTDWALCLDGCLKQQFQTQGLNPFMLDDNALTRIFANDVQSQLAGVSPQEIRFYGAGCRDAQIGRMTNLLQKCFPEAVVAVASDLLGAAKALCGTSPGIACILGTGSNSCLFDGNRIIANVPALGFILGDEGSGAVLGRRLVSDVFKQQLSPDICQCFHDAYPDTMADVIQRVYSSSFPNRYLAHFAPFLSTHADIPEIHQLLKEEFTKFLQRNVMAYCRPDLPVHFVGSIAYHFSSVLSQCIAEAGLQLGEILKAPFERLERL